MTADQASDDASDQASDDASDDASDQASGDKASARPPLQNRGGAELIVTEPDEQLTQVISRLADDGDRPVERGELGQILRLVQVSVLHSGPLPPPQMLRGYDEIIPTGAERIMKMAELEQGHRHSLEMRAQGLIETSEGHDFLITKRGQTFGLLSCFGVLLVALILAALNQTTLAGVLVGLDLVALVSVFVVGRYLPGRAQKPENVDDDASDGPAGE